MLNQVTRQALLNCSAAALNFAQHSIAYWVCGCLLCIKCTVLAHALLPLGVQALAAAAAPAAASEGPNLHPSHALFAALLAVGCLHLACL
jgi:hypothetical protein